MSAARARSRSLSADGEPKRCYRVVNSCLMFLPMAAGREIYTVEALAVDGELSDAQRAMASGGGSQCGYCTPGFVVSLFAEQYRPDRTGPCDTMALAGNLCRCTGYRPIRDAARSLGPAPEDEFRQRLDRAGARARAVLDRVDSRDPRRWTPAWPCCATHPGAKVVAGATDLGVESNLFARRWPHLISLDAIEELREFSSTSERVTIGAALPLNEIGERWTDAPDAFREWLALFASPLIRNRATIGGNLATASPIGDAAPMLLALDAIVHVAGSSGRRSIPLSSFFTGYRTDGHGAGRADRRRRDSEAASAVCALLQGGEAASRRHQHGRRGDGARRRFARQGRARAIRVRRRGGDPHSSRARPKRRSSISRGTTRRSSACRRFSTARCSR